MSEHRSEARNAKAVLRVLIVEDHAIVRQGLCLLLERKSELSVVGEAASLAEALELDVRPDPDVVLADLMLGDARGPEVISGLRSRFATSAILVLTMVDELSEVRAALGAGANGYILKDAAAEDLVAAIVHVGNGEDYLEPTLGAALARQVTGGGEDAALPLSLRERDVLRLVALGHTNAEVAELLHVAVRTVEAHRAHILQKLALRTRADLVSYAITTGLVDVGPG